MNELRDMGGGQEIQPGCGINAQGYVLIPANVGSYHTQKFQNTALRRGRLLSYILEIVPYLQHRWKKFT